MECTELDATQHAHWAAFPYALEEIARFAQVHEPDRNLVTFLQTVRDDWTQARQTCGIFIWHADAKVLVPLLGHVLLAIEEDCVGLYTHIWHANIQPHAASECKRALMDESLEKVRTWSKQRGVMRLRIATSRNPDAYVRRYGFTKLRTWLGMEIPDDESS